MRCQRYSFETLECPKIKQNGKNTCSHCESIPPKSFIPKERILNWNERCDASCREQRREAEEKYGIRMEQTTITCARCGRSCWPGQHRCLDIALEEARSKKADRIIQEEEQKRQLARAGKGQILDAIKAFGVQKVAGRLLLSESTVSSWIQREKVPIRHLGRVRILLNTGKTIRVS
jgi:hypothetical protein